MQKKNISIEDVAQRAKVSITTVSRVINNIPTVSPQNRAKVEEAIAALKFKPNVSAQRLARGFTNAIGLVMPGYPGIFHSFYAMEVIRGVGHACETAHMDLVFHITNGMKVLNTNNVGGIIFADIIENRKQVETTIATGTPCIIINNVVNDLDVGYIAVDNIAGGKMAADYLISLGHERIAMITGNLSTQAAEHRNQGFCGEMKAKNIELPKKYIHEGDFSRRCARFATEHFLDLDEPPTAIFAHSDDMALEAAAVIFERGLKVPDDVSIIGFDDNPACLYGPMAMTTIKQPLFKMAEEAVKYLHALITGKNKKAKKRTILEPELVMRESCAPPKK